MVIKFQLPALALAASLVTIALALLNADRIGEGLILGVVALIAARHWARRCADAYLARLYAEHGDRMDQELPAAGDRHTPRRPASAGGEAADGSYARPMGRRPPPRDRPARKGMRRWPHLPPRSSRRRCGSTPPPRLRTSTTAGSCPYVRR